VLIPKTLDILEYLTTLGDTAKTGRWSDISNYQQSICLVFISLSCNLYQWIHRARQKSIPL